MSKLFRHALDYKDAENAGKQRNSNKGVCAGFFPAHHEKSLRPLPNQDDIATELTLHSVKWFTLSELGQPLQRLDLCRALDVA